MANEVSHAAYLGGESRSLAAVCTADVSNAARCADETDIAADALEARDRTMFRVVLGDLLAPKGEGFALLRSIRLQNPRARILIVRVAGSTFRDVGEIRAAALDILADGVDRQLRSPTLDVARNPRENQRPGVIPARQPTDFPAPRNAWRGEAVRVDGGAIVPGFSAPEQTQRPKAPVPRETSNADSERVAAAEGLVGMPFAEGERLIIEATVRACGDSLPNAARVLGVSPSTLYRKRFEWKDPSGEL